MKCPSCGSSNVQRTTRTITYTYKGFSTEVPNVLGDYCTACGDVLFDQANGDRYSKLTSAFRKKVNASVVDPHFICQVRSKLKLDQREAAEIFGGGVNAFSRYETGKTIPPRSLVKLLKLLDRHPQLLKEVRAA